MPTPSLCCCGTATSSIAVAGQPLYLMAGGCCCTRSPSSSIPRSWWCRRACMAIILSPCPLPLLPSRLLRSRMPPPLPLRLALGAGPSLPRCPHAGLYCISNIRRRSVYGHKNRSQGDNGNGKTRTSFIYWPGAGGGRPPRPLKYIWEEGG